MADVELFAEIPNPPTPLYATSDLDPVLIRFKVPFVGGSNQGDSFFNQGFHVWGDLAILKIGGVDYLYPEVKLAILGFSVKETLSNGEVIYLRVSDDDDIVLREDPQIAENPNMSRLYMDFDPYVQTIYRDFAMEPGKEYFLEVLAARFAFPGGATLSGRFVVVPTDFASGPRLADGTVEVRGGVFETNFVNYVSITGDPTSPAETGQYLQSSGPNATQTGGAGSDTIVGHSGSNRLHGGDGNDVVRGGSGFDDTHGNQGNDLVDGGDGDDWVVGGKGEDQLSGGSGVDIVLGNIGADTCDGGGGADVVRGGQDNDVVRGGAGDDYVSGDRGNDTMTGGAGADRFHSFGEAGIDRVTDFSRSDGDRVQLDPGTTYTLAQVGGDTVVSMTGGGQVVLVGVSLNSLSGDWIFVG